MKRILRMLIDCDRLYPPGRRSSTQPLSLILTILVAAIFFMFTGGATMAEEWEFEADESLRQEEWYDPSDWFNDDGQIGMESNGYDFYYGNPHDCDRGMYDRVVYFGYYDYYDRSEHSRGEPYGRLDRDSDRDKKDKRDDSYNYYTDDWWNNYGIFPDWY